MKNVLNGFDEIEIKRINMDGTKEYVKKHRWEHNRFVNLELHVINDVITRSSFFSNSGLVGMISVIGVFWSLIFGGGVFEDASSKEITIACLSIGVVFLMATALLFITLRYYLQEQEAIMAYMAVQHGKYEKCRRAVIGDLFNTQNRRKWFIYAVMAPFMIHMAATITYVVIVFL